MTQWQYADEFRVQGLGFRVFFEHDAMATCRRVESQQRMDGLGDKRWHMSEENCKPHVTQGGEETRDGRARGRGIEAKQDNKSKSRGDHL
jgi:hypothetical protein